MKRLLHPLLNKRGYALLLTLVAITIFSVLGITFMTHGINTAKQTAKIEEKVLAIDMAELGVEYYNHIIDEELENIKNDIIALLNSERIKLEESENNYTYEYIQQYLKNLAYNEIHSRINEIPTNLYEKIMDSSEKVKSFNIVDWSSNYNDFEKKIEFKVKGKVEENEALIKANLELHDINFGDSNSSNWIDKVILNDIVFEYCNKNDAMFKNKRCEFNEDWGINNKDIMLERSIFKLNKNLVFDNLQDLDFGGSVFYVQGNFYSKNLHGSKDYAVYVGGNASVGQLKETEKIYLFVNGDADIKHLENIKNSVIFVNGNLSMGKTDGAQNTKICAKNIESYDGGDADVYALEIGDVKDVKKKAKDDIEVGEEKFYKNCNWNIFENGDGDGISWNIPISKREYEYE